MQAIVNFVKMLIEEICAYYSSRPIKLRQCALHECSPQLLSAKVESGWGCSRLQATSLLPQYNCATLPNKLAVVTDSTAYLPEKYPKQYI